MYKILCAFCIFFVTLPSLYADHHTLSKQPTCVIAELADSSFVNETINVIDGNFYFSNCYLKVPGHIPLDLVQYYNNKSTYTSWFGIGMSLNYSFWMQSMEGNNHSRDKSNKFDTLIVESPGGSILSFLGKTIYEAKTKFYLDPAMIHKGISNCNGGQVGARTNIKNAKVHQRHYAEGYVNWDLHMPDGSVREYGSALDQFYQVNVISEKRADKTRLDFHYYKAGGRYNESGSIKLIKAKAHHEMNWLRFSQNNDKATIESSNGKKVTFYADSSEHIKKITSTDNPEMHFEYNRTGDYVCIHRIKRPEGRFLEIDYDKKGRVIAQKAPVGTGEHEKRTIYSLNYYDDKTEVFDAYQRKKVYRLKGGRVTAQEQYNGDALYRVHAFYWGKKDHLPLGEEYKTLEGNLVGEAVLNNEHAGLSLRNFSYDPYGNITKESTYGNLTGSSPSPFWIDESGNPKDPNTEQYNLYYVYSPNLHLVTYQTEDAGPSCEYRYISGTDLMWAKLLKDDQKIIQREFYEYNKDGIEIEKIIDDGNTDNKSCLSGVTQRLVTHTWPIQTNKDGFGQGLPQDVWENYLDVSSNTLILLKHIHYNYNKAGQVIEEAVFDAHNDYKYSTWYEYDHKSRLKKLTNPLKQTFIYGYDDNNNKTYEKQENTQRHAIYEYDKVNRCISVTHYHDDGVIERTSFEYDLMGNKIFSIDRYGNKTSYEYDQCNRLVKVILPQLRDGHVHAILKEYDFFDNVVKETNQNGAVTTFEYTSRKTPSCITYPDATRERFEYNLNGTLANKWDRSSTKTSYKYDVLGRITETSVFDSNNAKFSTTFNVYNTFHLLSTTDPMGNITQFKYDGAGRKIEESKEAGGNFSKLTFSYDSLGRLSCTKNFYGNEASDYIATVVEYDNLNRVILERQLDKSYVCTGWTYYEFNVQGQCILQRSGHAEEDTEINNSYNSQGELVATIDQYGNCTQIDTDHNFINSQNQRVVRRITTDPLNNRTEEYHDALGRLVSIVKKNSQDKLLAVSELFYSDTNQKIKQIEHVIVDGEIAHEYTIIWEYDALDRITKLVEEPATLDEKVTSYTYDLSGRIATLTKPDGNILTYTYDPLGRLVALRSSDGTVAYAYIYDLNNNPLEVVDEVSKLTSIYEYDAWNRTILDGIKDEFVQQYAYDSLGRLLSIIAPDKTVVSYSYNNNHLQSIAWKDYVHAYNAFDLKSRPLKSTLIGNAGTQELTWDKKGRTTQIVTSHFTQSIPEDGFDSVGNLKKCSFTDPLGTVDIRAEYDDLYQLTSETGMQNHVYTNDSISNRRSKDNAAYTFDNTNKLLRTAENVFAYDKNGNLIEQKTGSKTISFTYDALDRLIKVSDGSQETTYIYDNFHRRIVRSINSKKPEYFLHLGQREIGVYDSATKKLKEYRVLGLGKGAEIGASVAIELDGKIYCPNHDFRGNIIALVDAKTGNIAESYRYTAFGECEMYDSNQKRLTHSAIHNPWGFASKRQDPETGYVYFSRRYYAPTTGRWITPDPLGFADGPNMYSYVHNSPMTHFDLYGLFANDDEYDAIEGAGLYGMLEVTARTIVDLSSYGAYVMRGRDGYDYCQNWHNKLDDFRNHYADQVAGMPGSKVTALELHQAMDAGNFSRTSFDLPRLGLNLSKMAIRNGNSILSGIKNITKNGETDVISNISKVAKQNSIIEKTSSANKIASDHIMTKSSPFIHKNAKDLHEMFIKKGFRAEGPDPQSGLGNYINLKNKRQYHIDPKTIGRYSEPNHVDVSRLKDYKGPLEKKRFGYAND